jgi:large subunit ribosomal protein L31
MKDKIHPKYYSDAKITCACGVVYSVGATKEKMEIEVCGNCHPFYTGQGMGSARGSRIERFRKRAEKHETVKTTRKKTAIPAGGKAAPKKKKVLKSFQ